MEGGRLIEVGLYYVTIMNEWNDLIVPDWTNGYDLLNSLNCSLNRS